MNGNPCRCHLEPALHLSQVQRFECSVCDTESLTKCVIVTICLYRTYCNLGARHLYIYIYTLSFYNYYRAFSRDVTRTKLIKNGRHFGVQHRCLEKLACLSMEPRSYIEALGAQLVGKEDEWTN